MQGYSDGISWGKFANTTHYKINYQGKNQHEDRQMNDILTDGFPLTVM